MLLETLVVLTTRCLQCTLHTKCCRLTTSIAAVRTATLLHIMTLILSSSSYSGLYLLVFLQIPLTIFILSRSHTFLLLSLFISTLNIPVFLMFSFCYISFISSSITACSTFSFTLIPFMFLLLILCFSFYVTLRNQSLKCKFLEMNCVHLLPESIRLRCSW